jgi:hypothetical protein
MTGERLTAILAQRIIGWRVGPKGFFLGNRQWITRSHFQPFNRIQDAFKLLHKAASAFSLTKTPDGLFSATVRVGDRSSVASGSAVAATITRAIALAIGLKVETSE